MSPRAVTGTYDQVNSKLLSLLDQGLVEKDCSGIEIFTLIWIKEDLWTLSWMPKRPRQRKQTSVKSLNKKAAPFGLHVQPVNCGFEVVSDLSGKRICFAKTVIGIQRKLTKEINLIEMKKVEQIIMRTMPITELVSCAK